MIDKSGSRSRSPSVASVIMSADLPVMEPPSGSQAYRFCELVRLRSSTIGVDVAITCQLWSAGGYIVDVDVSAHLGLLFEVDDWVDGVRVMDPHGEDVTVAEAVDYFAARATGHPPDEAWRLVLGR